jgi:type VI secretion system protein ImpB
MGVLSDLSGNPAEALPRLKDRKFVEVNPDNFDSVLKSMKPRVQFTVANKLNPE